MNKNIDKVIEVLKRNKKRIIRGISIFGVVAIGLGVAGTTILYNKAKSNINYTEEQAKEIALKLIPGEVVRIDRDLELEDCTFEYDIKIKDKNNMLREVTVDASLGVISDSDYND
jgi:uncharacterized membrane protein YkoI